jgi:hypothetical protein
VSHRETSQNITTDITIHLNPSQDIINQHKPLKDIMSHRETSQDITTDITIHLNPSQDHEPARAITSITRHKRSRSLHFAI